MQVLLGNLVLSQTPWFSCDSLSLLPSKPFRVIYFFLRLLKPIQETETILERVESNSF